MFDSQFTPKLQSANPIPVGFLLFCPLSQILSRRKLRRATKPLAAGWHLPGLALRLIPWTTNCILPCHVRRDASQRAVEIGGNRCKSKKNKIAAVTRSIRCGKPLPCTISRISVESLRLPLPQTAGTIAEFWNGETTDTLPGACMPGYLRFVKLGASFGLEPNGVPLYCFSLSITSPRARMSNRE